VLSTAANPLSLSCPFYTHAHTHIHRFFAGFSSWIEVIPTRLRDARMEVPRSPGLYEWGAKGPEGEVTAFYLGKAGESSGSQCRAFTTPYAELPISPPACFYRLLSRRAVTHSSPGTLKPPVARSKARKTPGETLRSRWNKYAVQVSCYEARRGRGEKECVCVSEGSHHLPQSDRVVVQGKTIGPRSEEDKMLLFRDLQRRGFTMVYR
jgi:hypothetical protein